MLSEQAFRIVIDASHQFQIRNLKFATSADVMHAYFDSRIAPQPELVRQFHQSIPLAGDICMYAQIIGDYRQPFEILRQRLSDVLGGACDTRCAVVFSYYHLMQNLS